MGLCGLRHRAALANLTERRHLRTASWAFPACSQSLSALRQARPAHPRLRADHALPLVPFHLGIGLTRRVEWPLGVFPLPLYDAFEFTLGMQHVQAHRHCLLGDGPSSLARRASGGFASFTPRSSPWPPSAMTCSRHGQRVITSPNSPHGDPDPVGPPSTPCCGVRLPSKQARDVGRFLETEHPHASLTGQIEHHQQTPRLRRRRLHPATDHGPTGHSAQRQHDR